MTERSHSPHWYPLLQVYAERAAPRYADFREAELTGEQAEQYRITGKSFFKWARDLLPIIQSNRQMLSYARDYPEHPFLIVTAAPVGLAAVRLLLQPHSRAFLLPRQDWEAFAASANPPAKALVHYWSYFEPVQGDLARSAQLKFLGVPWQDMLVHRVGHRFNEKAGQETLHLWHRTSNGYQLLQEEFYKTLS